MTSSVEAPEAAIDRVLAERSVVPVFQPIVDLHTGLVVGVEALARGPAGTPLQTPAGLFTAARRAGNLAEVDMLCAARALEFAGAAGAHVPSLVFINAEPAALDRPLSPDLLAAIHSGLPFRIVLEFTERALTNQPAALMRIADTVRLWGNAVAMDDVGALPESLAFLPVIAPEVVKLDMSLVRDPTGPRAVDITAAVGAYSERTGAVVLAEGIETEKEWRAALAFGARWGQGWLFGHPGPLADLAPNRIARDARLVETVRPALCPGGTPFDILEDVAERIVRLTDRPVAVDLWGHLRRQAERLIEPPVVLCATGDAGLLAQFAGDAAALAGRAAFIGLLSPFPVSVPPGVEAAVLDPSDPMADQTTLVLLGSHSSWSVCARSEPQGYRTALVQDTGRVQAIARLLLQRHNG